MNKERLYIDWRKNPQWEEMLGEIVSPQVFFEGRNRPKKILTVNRLQVFPNENFVLYSLPPSPKVGKELLAKVSPERVYLVFRSETELSCCQFLETLLGMVKFDLENKGGRGSLLEMAVALGQRTETIQFGLDYLVAKGLLEYGLDKFQQVTLDLGSGKPRIGVGEAERKVRILLEETKAFRRYLVKGPIAQVREYFY